MMFVEYARITILPISMMKSGIGSVCEREMQQNLKCLKDSQQNSLINEAMKRSEVLKVCKSKSISETDCFLN